MRAISQDLKQEFIDGFRCTIIKITTKDGTVYGYTDLDVDIRVGPTDYRATPGLIRTNLTSSSDEQVSSQELASGWLDAPENDLISGKFDDAEVEVAFASPRNPGLGKFVIQRGNIGVVQWTEDGFRADVQSHMRKLAKNFNLIVTPSCRHALFSTPNPFKAGFCGVNKSSFTYNGVVNGIVLNKLRFTATGLLVNDKWLQGGTLTFLTGANAGLTYQVKKHEVTGVATIELFLPTIAPINGGDTFEVTAGCDKTESMCKTKFNNFLNFGGFPHIQTEVNFR